MLAFEISLIALLSLLGLTLALFAALYVVARKEGKKKGASPEGDEG